MLFGSDRVFAKVVQAQEVAFPLFRDADNEEPRPLFSLLILTFFSFSLLYCMVRTLCFILLFPQQLW